MCKKPHPRWPGRSLLELLLLLTLLEGDRLSVRRIVAARGPFHWSLGAVCRSTFDLGAFLQGAVRAVRPAF